MPLIKTNSSDNGRKPDCSVIITAKSGVEYLQCCLDAILLDQAAINFEVIVINCRKMTGFDRFTASAGEDIQSIDSSDNLSTAKAINMAARNVSGKYMIILADDTLPTPGWLDQMITILDKDEKIGVAAPKLLYPLHRLVQHCGIIFDDSAQPIHIYQGFPGDHPAVNRMREFQAVSGICIAVRTDIFRDINGMSEDYRDGFEDLDFCFRVRQAGARVMYIPSAQVFYYGRSSQEALHPDSEDAMRFRKKWKREIHADGLEYFTEDGYEVKKTAAGFSLKPKGVDLKKEIGDARQLFKDGRTGEALTAFERIYYLLPHYPTVIGYLAKIHEKRGDFEQAVTMLLRMSTLQPGAGVLLKLAQCEFKMQQYDLAVKFATAVLETVPDHADMVAGAYAVIGDTAFKRGDPNRAEEAFRSALNVQPKSVRAMTGLGTIMLSRHDYDSALKCFEQALETGPHHGRAILGRGLACMGLQRTDDAIRLLSEGMELEPDNEWVLMTVVPLLLNAGRADEADTLLERFLDRYPDDVNILLARAGVAFTVEKYTECRVFINLVLELDPSNKSANELIQNLEDIHIPDMKTPEYTTV